MAALGIDGLYEALRRRPPMERTALAVGAACALFTGLELLLHVLGSRLMTSWFAANPRLSKQEAALAAGQTISRILGAVHNAIQIPLGIIILQDKTHRASRLHGSTPLSMLMMSVSAGFFLHDLVTCLRRWDGWSYTVHAAGCMSVFLYGLHTDTLHYYGGVFLMWELSTFFVHARWLLFKLGKADTKLYVANGLAMIATFFFARNVFGVYMSLCFWQDTARELTHPKPESMSPVFVYACRTVNWMLNALNAYWMYKMLQAAVKVLLLGQQSSKVSNDKDE